MVKKIYKFYQINVLSLSSDDLQKTIKDEMLEKNSTIISLRKKLDETKSESSKVNRTYNIKVNKSNQQNIYSNQRVHII